MKRVDNANEINQAEPTNQPTNQPTIRFWLLQYGLHGRNEKIS